MGTIPLILCLILSTWSSMASSKKVTHHLSGEEMFRGIFFAEGQFAELIPELKATQTMYSSNQLSVDEKRALALARTQIIASIKASNPHYFEDFKASIQTANPVLIKEKIMEGQGIVTKNALKLSNLKETDLKSLDSFLAKEGKSVDRKTLTEYMKKMSKEESLSKKANNGTGNCIALLLYNWMPFLAIAVPILYKPNNHTNLMVCSICTIAPTVG